MNPAEFQLYEVDRFVNLRDHKPRPLSLSVVLVKRIQKDPKEFECITGTQRDRALFGRRTRPHSSHNMPLESLRAIVLGLVLLAGLVLSVLFLPDA